MKNKGYNKPVGIKSVKDKFDKKRHVIMILLCSKIMSDKQCYIKFVMKSFRIMKSFRLDMILLYLS